MNSNIEIIYQPEPSADEIQVLYKGISEHAQLMKNQPPIETFGFFVRDNNQKIVGGCSCAMFYGCLSIDSLWIDTAFRGNNIGTRLIESVEEVGKKHGCIFATVNTMDWEALGFYQKLGYGIEHERTGYFNDSTFYFLRKKLITNDRNKVPTEIDILPFSKKDIDLLVDTFAKHHWPKPSSTFLHYLQEQAQNQRVVWLAFFKQQLAGYITLKWASPYPPFLEQSIPEIMDLNVLPPYRQHGIGSLLLETAEKEASKQSNKVGLGVGLYPDYGSAQRLYMKKGYIPDGLGVTYEYKSVKPGSNVRLDDDLILWFTKQLNGK